MHGEETEFVDPWTRASKTGRGETEGGVLPARAQQRRVGERVHSYQSGDADIWGDRVDARRIDAERAWASWGDFVSDPLSRGKEARSYESRMLRRGARTPSLRYAQTHPFPTYSQFGKPQWVDVMGRQFRRADGSDAKQLEEQGVLDEFKKDALLYIRFPRGSRERLAFPRPRSTIAMVELQTGTLYAGTVGWVEGDASRSSATGSVFVENMTDMGPASEETIRRAVGNLPRGYQRFASVPK